MNSGVKLNGCQRIAKKALGFDDYRKVKILATESLWVRGNSVVSIKVERNVIQLIK